MLDIKFIRENPNLVEKGCNKKMVKININRILEIDKKKRQTLQALEDMRAKKNKANKEIQKLNLAKQSKGGEKEKLLQRAKNEKEKKKIILKMQELDRNNDRLDKDFKELEKKFNDLMLQIPNLPQKNVPVGKDERDNLVLQEVGKKPKFNFEPKDYLQIAENLDLIDIKRAAKVSGTRFGYLKKEAVLLEFALINFAFEALLKKGFIPIIPPVMLKAEMARGMGYLEQTDQKEAYYLPKDDLYLIGTSEQSIGAMHANEILDEKELPKRYAAFSACFRRESGSYGKDTKGILRVHQFDKIEMFSFCKPKEAEKEHQFLLETQEELMQKLNLPYRIVSLCAGDLGRPSAATFDIETWLPSENCYRETHSASNCTDFQSRRLNIRYRNKNNQLNFVHTLNGTAFAIGRMIIMIIENYQQKDGSVLVPKVLQKYAGFEKIGKN